MFANNMSKFLKEFEVKLSSSFIRLHVSNGFINSGLLEKSSHMILKSIASYALIFNSFIFVWLSYTTSTCGDYESQPINLSACEIVHYFL